MKYEPAKQCTQTSTPNRCPKTITKHNMLHIVKLSRCGKKLLSLHCHIMTLWTEVCIVKKKRKKEKKNQLNKMHTKLGKASTVCVSIHQYQKQTAGGDFSLICG
jgi:hypothetical protein